VTVVRIAMWSGPRTVSTALMRAWENRPDTVVADEPLYSFYLSSLPGLDHPGRDEVIASQSPSWEVVLRGLAAGPLPDGATISYAKHMTHHVLPAVDLAAFTPFRHAFLIRDPRSLLASYAKVRSAPTLDDLGLRQQVRLFEEFGGPVIDSADLIAAPEAALRALCAALGVPFSPAMLSWPAGPRDSDGVWAPYWYDSVWRSTGFTPPAPSRPHPALDPALEPLLAQCLPYYERLSENKINIGIS
jgi:sulfotransferase family protein